jgi:hypothetical protein
VNVTADYNMDLVIALEMSRLQMIEDEMKKRQRAAEDAANKTQQQAADDSAGEAGTSIEFSSTPGMFLLFCTLYAHSNDC